MPPMSRLKRRSSKFASQTQVHQLMRQSLPVQPGRKRCESGQSADLAGGDHRGWRGRREEAADRFPPDAPRPRRSATNSWMPSARHRPTRSRRCPGSEPAGGAGVRCTQQDPAVRQYAVILKLVTARCAATRSWRPTAHRPWLPRPRPGRTVASARPRSAPRPWPH